MITVEQALDKILGRAAVLEAEESPILDCLGQVLARDVTSDIDVPPLDNSAMDGYAVRAADTAGADDKNPRVLRVIDTVPAGSISRRRVESGTAVRIMTGAPVPAGADSVVIFEDTDETERAGHPAEIGILIKAQPGQNIRRAGEDIARGVMVLGKGTLLRPSEVGVLASLGLDRVSVIRRPVVAVLVTGDELVAVGEPLTEGKIYNSNSYSLAALVRHYGGIPKVLGIARDSEDSVVAGLCRGLDADMLITSGGVSAGDYDVVKDVLAKQGEIAFHRVKMKPGKPLAFGVIRGNSASGEPKNIPHLGLPGNPVSSMITFELFARPAMFKMMGRRQTAKPTVRAVVEDAVANTDGRRVYTRVIVQKRQGRYYARLTGPQGSGILTSMARANGLMIIPDDKRDLSPGDEAEVIMLDWSEE